MTPTATWWFKASTDLIAAVALEKTFPSVQAPAQFGGKWKENGEHWFNAPFNLTSALDVTKLELRSQNACTSPLSPGFEQDASFLVAEWKARFVGDTVLYEPGKLDLWKKGTPGWAPNEAGYYFESPAGTDPQARVYFQLDSGGMLEAMVWLTDAPFGGFKLSAEPIQLERVKLDGKWPSAELYYECR